MLNSLANRPANATSSEKQEMSNELIKTENVADGTNSPVSEDVEQEPEFHLRTWAAIGAMFLLNLVQLIALTGPPVVLSDIGKSVDGTKYQTWIPNALSLVQAVLGPPIASASDTFQARKLIVVTSCAISVIGAAIAPGSQSLARILIAQVLIGIGFAVVPIAYSVPSEILPRRWRPMAQAGMNVAAACGAISAPLIIGGLSRRNANTGWRYFYWIQMAIWSVTGLGIFFGYTPPPRHSRLDHLNVWQKIGQLDLPGNFLITAGLTLFLVALNSGGELANWSNGRVLGPMIAGLGTLVAFAIWEWKGIKTGVLHHDLFRGGTSRGRTFAICIGLIFLEGVLLFTIIVFYPILTTTMFTSDPLTLALRGMPFWCSACISTVIFGGFGMRFRTIRAPMFVGFALFTGGMVGLATIEPDDSVSACVFDGLAGIGFGAPITFIVAGVQLSTPHHSIATATALTTSARAVAATIFTAIYSTTLTERLAKFIPKYVAAAAIKAGLPPASVGAFVGALAHQNNANLAHVKGVTPAIIEAGAAAIKQAYADALRVIFIIAAPFGVLACIGCLFLGDMTSTMNYHVDAPMEELREKHHDDPREAGGAESRRVCEQTANK